MRCDAMRCDAMRCDAMGEWMCGAGSCLRWRASAAGDSLISCVMRIWRPSGAPRPHHGKMHLEASFSASAS
eukprot:8219372-Pyramimonas_sp.AAC.1